LAQLERLSPERRAFVEQRLRAARATSEAVSEATGIPRRGAGMSAPLTPGQDVLWTMQRALPELTAYNVPRVLAVRGALDVDALRAALDALVSRHEVLRTRYVASPDGPRQEIEPAGAARFELIDLREPLQGAPAESRAAAALERVEERIRTPFDLASEAPFRTTLVRWDDDAWYLLLLTHHIASDEGSRDILFRELERLYEGAQSGTLDAVRSALPTLPVQFADFATWQSAELARGTLDAQVTYWRARLAGLRPLELPTDRRGATLPTFAGARVRATLPADVGDGVRRLALSTNASPYMVLLAAVKALLYRYTAQRDVAVGAPVAGRRHPDLENVMGYFPSQVVLRTDVDPDAPFAALVQRVRETCLSAFEHQDVPLERLLQEVTDRNDPRAPLFRVSVQMTGGAASTPRLGDARVETLGTDAGNSKFDLVIGFDDRPDGLRVLLEYRIDLFDASTIERLAEHLGVFLAGVTADPTVAVAHAPLLTERERTLLLDEWNATDVPFERDATVPDLVRRAAERTPDAVAVRGAGGTLTFAELEASANRLAVLLQDEGVRAGTRVGVYMRRDVELMPALLAVMKAGGAYIPIDPVYPVARVETMLADADAVCVLTQPALAAGLARSARPTIVLSRDAWPVERDLPADSRLPVRSATADDHAYVIYTSGSTGTPKGAMITHRGLVNYLQWAVTAYEVERGRGAPVHSSISFDLTVTSLWAPLIAGRPAVLVPDDAGVEGLVDLLRAEGDFSLIKITPAHLELLERSLGADAVGGRTRYFVIGGEPLPGESLQFWQRYAPETFHVNEYGPTETVVGCCVEFVTAAERVTGQVPIGHPIANTTLYVLDPAGEPVPVGVAGELYIGGAGVCSGYLGKPELTAERFVPDPFAAIPGARLYRTGDQARRRADGVLEYLGRLDFQVKLRGFRIELGEIESVLASDPTVQTVVVLAREDAPGDKRLVAYVVPSDGAERSAAALRARVDSRLPEYMVPSAFVFLDEMPLNSNGKVDRGALPAPDPSASSVAAYVAPRSSLEAQICDVWTEMLGVARIGVNDDFFALGGHSLLAMRVIARLAEVLPVRLTIGAMFEARTVAALAARVVASLAEAEESNDLEALLSDLDGLSDEDAAHLLADEAGEAR
jgi:amino acid adenylation domain-containing protein